MAAFALILLGKADAVLAVRARGTVADLIAPIYGALAPPLAAMRDLADNAEGIATLAADNARLRTDNARLLRWHDAAIALQAENAALKAQLHWIPTPAAPFVTAQVVADAGGLYARSVLVAVGPAHFIAKGDIALDDRGLVGRVTEVGSRSARILLVTDINSRVPVILERSHARAILAGTNGELPRLLYYPDDKPPVEGERVVTSAEAEAFPGGLPVGTVHYNEKHVPQVRLAAGLDRLQIVRVFDYGLSGVLPPEAAQKPARADKPTRTAERGR